MHFHTLISALILTFLALFASFTTALPATPISLEDRGRGPGSPGRYYLVCTIGYSAQRCHSMFGTYCDDNGVIQNNAKSSTLDGWCSSIWRYCYCEPLIGPLLPQTCGFFGGLCGGS